MKSTYSVSFVGTVSGSSSSNGPVFTSTRKRDAIAHAKRATVKNAGNPDFKHGFYEVLCERPGVVPHYVFQSKAVK